MNDQLAEYLSSLAWTLRRVAGGELVGVYVGGSYALGSYEAGRSDMDVAAVVRSPAARTLKEEIVGAIRHEALPCPGRGLEFVLYQLAVTAAPTVAAGFELNLNSGAAMEFRVDWDTGGIEPHWFPIDRSILSAHGVAVTGPPANEVFAPIPRRLLLPVILESLRWHGAGSARSDDAVLNACRALRFAVEGVWSSKPAAAAWAVDHLDAPEVVFRALDARRDDAPLDPAEAHRFVQTVIGLVEPKQCHEGGV